jgi:phage baseplate assembly protein W
MAQSNNISINFPFIESKKGYYLDMTTTDAEDVRASLMHLLLTNKGERFMMPEFGTDLLKFIFEPNDSKSINDLKIEINTTVSKFIRNIQIDDIIIENSNLSNELISIKIEYTTSDGIYTVSDTLTIEV